MDLSEVQIQGPCRITFKGVDLGHTVDGVTLVADRKFAKPKVDKHGDSPIDLVLTGTEATAKFKLAQDNFRNKDLMMPETSSYDNPSSKLLDRVDIGADAGYSLRQDAGPLVIHPLKYGEGDLSHDVTLYLAVNQGAVELGYKIDEQTVFEVEMLALVSEAFGSGRRLGHIGSAAVS